ncbi:MAG: hypothetical protein KBD53_03180 [Candidatus Omnitrophica bacterium]|nr:hypothetical protein [Candidatus Omnitrophota bacterium]
MRKFFMTAFLITQIAALPHIAHAGAGLEQRMKAVKEQRAQQMQQMQQQSMMQQRQAQQQAANQQMAQRQMQVYQQQMALQQAMRSNQQQFQQQTVQQQQQAYDQVLQSKQLMEQQFQQNQASMFQGQTTLPEYAPVEPYVEDVVEMADLWEDLKISSEAWPLVIDMEAKGIIVGKFIEDYRAQGVRIKKDPQHYAELIDSMSFDNPEVLKNPFDKLLQIVAIVEYDFNNGVDPDRMARQVLGEQGYQQNKQRLGK